MSDFKKRTSIIETLIEANKIQELVYFVKNILKNNSDQQLLNMIIQDLPLLLSVKKVVLNDFFNLSMIEE